MGLVGGNIAVGWIAVGAAIAAMIAAAMLVRYFAVVHQVGNRVQTQSFDVDLVVSTKPLPSWWPATWWGSGLMAALLAYVGATTVPVSMVGGLTVILLSYTLSMLIRYLLFAGRAPVATRSRRRILRLRDGCLAAALGCTLSAVGACRNLSALNTELEATEGALSRAENALAEMGSLGYAISLAAEGFVRGFCGDLGGIISRVDEETTAQVALTNYAESARMDRDRIAVSRHAVQAQAAWSISTLGLFLAGSGYCALRANATSRSQ